MFFMYDAVGSKRWFMYIMQRTSNRVKELFFLKFLYSLYRWKFLHLNMSKEVAFHLRFICSNNSWTFSEMIPGEICFCWFYRQVLSCGKTVLWINSLKKQLICTSDFFKKVQEEHLLWRTSCMHNSLCSVMNSSVKWYLYRFFFFFLVSCNILLGYSHIII